MPGPQMKYTKYRYDAGTKEKLETQVKSVVFMKVVQENNRRLFSKPADVIYNVYALVVALFYIYITL